MDNWALDNVPTAGYYKIRNDMLLNDLLSSPRHNFFLLAGPCVIEG